MANSTVPARMPVLLDGDKAAGKATNGHPAGQRSGRIRDMLRSLTQSVSTTLPLPAKGDSGLRRTPTLADAMDAISGWAAGDGKGRGRGDWRQATPGWPSPRSLEQANSDTIKPASGLVTANPLWAYPESVHPDFGPQGAALARTTQQPTLGLSTQADQDAGGAESRAPSWPRPRSPKQANTDDEEPIWSQLVEGSFLDVHEAMHEATRRVACWKAKHADARSAAGQPAGPVPRPREAAPAAAGIVGGRVVSPAERRTRTTSGSPSKEGRLAPPSPRSGQTTVLFPEYTPTRGVSPQSVSPDRRRQAALAPYVGAPTRPAPLQLVECPAPPRGVTPPRQGPPRSAVAHTPPRLHPGRGSATPPRCVPPGGLPPNLFLTPTRNATPPLGISPAADGRAQYPTAWVAGPGGQRHYVSYAPAAVSPERTRDTMCTEVVDLTTPKRRVHSPGSAFRGRGCLQPMTARLARTEIKELDMEEDEGGSDSRCAARCGSWGSWCTPASRDRALAKPALLIASEANGFDEEDEEDFVPPGMIEILGTRYKIMKSIGNNKMGSVRLVQSAEGCNRFVVKPTTGELQQRKNDQRGLRNGVAHPSTQLSSPWVAKLLASFDHGVGGFSLLTEFCSGGTIEQLVDRRALRQPHWKFIMAEVVEAVISVHNLGFVHADLSERSVLISAHGHIRLQDFGRRNVFGIDQREWIWAENEDPMTTKADWWCVGAILHYLILGRRPARQAVQAARSQNPADDLLSCLLAPHQARLAPPEIRSHFFFAGIDFATVWSSPSPLPRT
mmetsp:Transcript_8168/g.17808  ORF Transcript_8168/g.17808 Transcript_8168/m.17808 type:complete len:785 (-) Transcript_8168:170-2524(-)|eukprot:CAMPEP_0204263454 /NCGR_PEP_ID=MMETSP0468-20130131/8368_1 /ASSEMBLY_ACC=CAM_ASM_000383 /TAXON_ID=2969 /ORGANISM="Oxyrrhis marina" /LENGTH=784 /DNA_ID=CAMNT_0051238231 /DNA_START=33 /DNA_END=2387 /DNA_ORIENTATION=-